MTGHIRRELIWLVVNVLIVLVVWVSYRSATSAPAKRYLTFGPRFWAGLVDSCVLWPVSFIAAVLFTTSIPRSAAAAVLIVQSLAWLLYTVVMHARRGQTVGKMVTKVRVVDNRTEGSISWRQAWLREGIPLLVSLGWIAYEVVQVLNGSWTYGTSTGLQTVLDAKMLWLLNSLPLLWFAAEVITMLTNEKRRALHDFIAGTVVIRTDTVFNEVAAGEESESDVSISGMSRRTQGWRSEE